MNGLRKFGLGILWAILSPVLLVGIALVAVFGVFNFLVQFVIMVINFFRGKKLFPMYPEDELAYKRIQQALHIEEEPTGEQVPATQPQQPQQVFVQQNFYTQQPGAMPGMMPPQGQAPFVQVPNGQIPQNPYGMQPNMQVPPLTQIPQAELPMPEENVIDEDGEDEQ